MIRRDLRAMFCPLWPACAWSVYSRGAGAAHVDIGLDLMRHVGAAHPEIVAGMTPAASWRARYRQLLVAAVGLQRN